MITKEEKLEKICSFYASDYHLEMIMIPYINKKIEEQENVVIITERSLKETVKDVILRINLLEKRKNEILNINWENSEVEVVNKMKTNKTLTIFVIGSLSFINKVNKKIENLEMNNKVRIVNCYSLEDVQDNMTEIVRQHKKVLNTTEEKEIA